MPGGVPGLEAGVPYGMGPVEWGGWAAGVRTPLASQFGRDRGGDLSDSIVGLEGSPEELIQRLSMGTGASREEILGSFIRSTIAGRVGPVEQFHSGTPPRAFMEALNQRRRGRGVAPIIPLEEAPIAEMVRLAGGLTTPLTGGAVSPFNVRVQEFGDVLGSLTSILEQRMQTVSRYDADTESAMQFAAAGMGGLMQNNVSTQVAQRIMGAVTNNLQNPGGGEAGRAMVMQALGYQMGLDPFQTRLAMENPGVAGQQAVFDAIQSRYGGAGNFRAMDVISQIYGLSAHDAQEYYNLMQSEAHVAARDLLGLRADPEEALVPHLHRARRAADDMAVARITAGQEAARVETGGLEGVQQTLNNIFRLQRTAYNQMNETLTQMANLFAGIAGTIIGLGLPEPIEEFMNQFFNLSGAHTTPVVVPETSPEFQFTPAQENTSGPDGPPAGKPGILRVKDEEVSRKLDRLLHSSGAVTATNAKQ